MIYQVPTLFFKDHLNRCDLCESAPIKVIKESKSLVTLDLDSDTFQDLKSDAEVYAELTGDDFQENRGLCLSARATLKKLEK